MSEREIQHLIREISKMAARFGCVFIPDPKKIAALTRPVGHSTENKEGGA